MTGAQAVGVAALIIIVGLIGFATGVAWQTERHNAEVTEEIAALHAILDTTRAQLARLRATAERAIR